MSTVAFLTLADVSVSFGGNTVLRNLSLTLTKGERWGGEVDKKVCMGQWQTKRRGGYGWLAGRSELELMNSMELIKIRFFTTRELCNGITTSLTTKTRSRDHP